MACPNCDHTMQHVGQMYGQTEREYAIWWCPRCGTLKYKDDKSTPKLVERVVKFVGHFGADDDTVIPMMRQLGIVESVTLPGQR